MDDFDFRESTSPSRSIATIVWNVLTALTLLATLCVAAVFLSIFINPNSSLNLFPPPTLPPALALPTLTPTPRGVLPPTWTPLPTSEPTGTETSPPSPTAQPLSTESPSTETPFALFTPSPLDQTATPGGMPYVLAQGSPVSISSLAFHPDQGCNWMGVAGQVLNLNGAPISTGVIIQLGGTLAGNRMDIPSLTGVAPQYGQAGFEIFLAEEPTASNSTLWVQLLDQEGAPLSEKVYFDTFEDCEKNLIFINFQQAR